MRSKPWSLRRWENHGKTPKFSRIFQGYPLVNIEKTGKSSFCSWVNPLFPWPFSIANC